jgi:hypothetical protein
MLCLSITTIFVKPIIFDKEKHIIPKNAQNDKTENVAGSVRMSLFMDGTGKCKLPSTHPITDNSSFQHLIMKMVRF